MIDKSDWSSIATNIFEGTKWDASDEDINQLSQRLLTIDSRHYRSSHISNAFSSCYAMKKNAFLINQI